MYQKNRFLKFMDYDFDIEVDKDIVDEFLKYPYLIKKLHEWVRNPDPALEPYLRQLEVIVDRLYKFKSVDIFRGIRTKSLFSRNNQLGIDEPRRIPFIKPGYVFRHRCSRPASFSLDIEIPKHFGDIIVKTKLPKKNRLVITDELMYCVFLYRKENKKLGTTFALRQKEVVVYNHEQLLLEVIQTNNKQLPKI